MIFDIKNIHYESKFKKKSLKFKNYLSNSIHCDQKISRNSV